MTSVTTVTTATTTVGSTARWQAMASKQERETSASKQERETSDQDGRRAPRHTRDLATVGSPDDDHTICIHAQHTICIHAQALHVALAALCQ